jgi:hypothetical protein
MTTTTNFQDQGREAWIQGEMRIVPRDILVENGIEAARSWYFGWDAVNLAAPWQVTLHDFANALSARGYDAKVAGLGGNIVGIEITTKSGAAWILSADEFWMLGTDDETNPNYGGIADQAELSLSPDVLVGWADQIMGCDR